MKNTITYLQNLGAEIQEQKANGSTYLFAEKIGTLRVSNHTITPSGLTMKNRFDLEIIKYAFDDNYRLYTGGRLAKIYDDYIDSQISNNEDVQEGELKEILTHIFKSENLI